MCFVCSFHFGDVENDENSIKMPTSFETLRLSEKKEKKTSSAPKENSFEKGPGFASAQKSPFSLNNEGEAPITPMSNGTYKSLPTLLIKQ